MQQQIQYPENYRQFNTQYPRSEVVSGMLWDTIAFTNATLQLTFFTVAKATVDLSNMIIGGQLPYPMAFLVRSIRLFLKQRPESANVVAPAGTQVGAVNNIALLYNTGSFQITVGAKQYGIYPLWILSSGGGPYGFMNVINILIAGGMADYGGMGTPHSRNAFTLAQPLFIEPQMSFKVDLYWPAALALTRTPLPLCVAFEGDLIRAVQ